MKILYRFHKRQRFFCRCCTSFRKKCTNFTCFSIFVWNWYLSGKVLGTSHDSEKICLTFTGCREFSYELCLLRQNFVWFLHASGTFCRKFTCFTEFLEEVLHASGIFVWILQASGEFWINFTCFRMCLYEFNTLQENFIRSVPASENISKTFYMHRCSLFEITCFRRIYHEFYMLHLFSCQS